MKHSGNIQNYQQIWENIKTDRFILDIMKKGLKIDFESMPKNAYIPVMVHKAEEKEVVFNEIEKLLKEESSCHVIGRKRILYQPYSQGKKRWKNARHSESKLRKRTC